ncbi:MAG: hypothetical protein ACR2M1_14950 [Gemmatimonadaceae bacterium]
MSHRAKLDRARQHFEAAEFTYAEFAKTEPYRIVTERDKKPGRYVLRAFIDHPIPEQMVLEIGDSVHNMRSALDHLVFAIAGFPADDRNIQFPIFDKKTTYDNCRWKLQNVPPAALAVIEELQPYQRGESANSQLLAILATLDNIDKHRRPILSGSVVSLKEVWGSGQATSIRITGRNGGAFKNGAVISTWEVSGREMDVNFTVAFRVALAEPAPLDGRDIGKLLEEIHRYIGDEVFPRFDSFL